MHSISQQNQFLVCTQFPKIITMHSSPEIGQFELLCTCV